MSERPADKRRGRSGSAGGGQADRWSILIASVGLVALVGVVVLNRRTAPSAGEAASGSNSVEVSSRPAVPAGGMSKLMGRWVRPDGGYVLEIRQVRGDGRLDAAYLNPRPIFISRAEAAMEPEGLRVRVELQDVGYPGCRYTLVYHPTNDVLAGEYYQAAIQESFDVVFTRMP